MGDFLCAVATPVSRLLRQIVQQNLLKFFPARPVQSVLRGRTGNAMSVVNDDIPRESKVSLVPTFKLAASVEAERGRMDWVKPGTVRIVRGIETSGGFYLHRPKSTPFSFAVNETSVVGRAENACSFPLRPGQSVRFRQLHYRDLHPDQRAAYLQWLSGATLPADISAFCVRVHVAAQEWRLFIDRADPGEIISELLDLLHCPPRAEEAPLVMLLAWAAYFHSREIHIDLLEELTVKGYTILDSSTLRLLLLDCAEIKRPVWPELALVIQTGFGGNPSLFSDAGFQQRFLERFRILYPDGLPISAGEHRTEVEYRIHCAELNGERCRFLVQDAVESALLALREVTAPLLSGGRLDATKLRRINEETLRSEAFLEERSRDFPEAALPPPPPQNSNTSSFLDERSVEILLALIQRPGWSEAEFTALVKSRGCMPLAIMEKLNGWAMENFGEPLLEGERPVAVNTNLRKEIEKQYNETE